MVGIVVIEHYYSLWVLFLGLPGVVPAFRHEPDHVVVFAQPDFQLILLVLEVGTPVC